MSVVKSRTITVTTGEVVAECPMWMQRLWKIAVEKDREGTKKWLQKLAERKGCTLTPPTSPSTRPENHRIL